MPIRLDGDRRDFEQAFYAICEQTGGVLNTPTFRRVASDAMAGGVYDPNSRGGWVFIADVRNAPADGILTPDNLGKLVTAAGGWQFMEFEEPGQTGPHALGYAVNAFNKCLWSWRNGWVSTLRLRYYADFAVGHEATIQELCDLGLADGPGELRRLDVVGSDG